MANRCGRTSSTNSNAGGADQHEERWRVRGNEAQMYDACEFPNHDYEEVMASVQAKKDEKAARAARAANPAHPGEPAGYRSKTRSSIAPSA